MTASLKGKIRLPIHLKWSGPREYDLSDPKERLRVYEIVLREGRADDISRFIDPDEVLRLWNSLVLPSFVRTAWADYFLVKRNQIVPDSTSEHSL
ncbi:MAG: hypothetical protein KGZ75_04725 [Syntrophomonadaceae bacterium]|nr:hypothetical protein [Syntrophomonadaceae bacterium]